MASNSESGHAKNVANFSQMLSICKSFGEKYNPSNPPLQLPQMTSSLALSKECMSSLNTVQATLSNALSARGGVFKPFKALVTRIGNAVKVSGVSKQTLDQVTAIVRKLQGRRATPKLSEEEKQAALAPGRKSLKSHRRKPASTTFWRTSINSSDYWRPSPNIHPTKLN